MPSRDETGSDICECGDFRSEHFRPGRTPDTCFCGCKKFRFSHAATTADMQIWNEYHSPSRPNCFGELPDCICRTVYESRLR